jgi:hypothetical protein
MEVDGAVAKPSSAGPGPMNEGLGPTTAATMEGRFADMCKVQALGCCGFSDARLGPEIYLFFVQVPFFLLLPWSVLGS